MWFHLKCDKKTCSLTWHNQIIFMFRFSISVALLLLFEVFRFSFAQNSVLICSFFFGFSVQVCIIVFRLWFFIRVNGGVRARALEVSMRLWFASAENTFWNATNGTAVYAQNFMSYSNKVRHECQMYVAWYGFPLEVTMPMANGHIYYSIRFQLDKRMHAISP